jgi:hypothetical protein
MVRLLTRGEDTGSGNHCCCGSVGLFWNSVSQRGTKGRGNNARKTVMSQPVQSPPNPLAYCGVPNPQHGFPNPAAPGVTGLREVVPTLKSQALRKSLYACGERAIAASALVTREPAEIPTASAGNKRGIAVVTLLAIGSSGEWQVVSGPAGRHSDGSTAGRLGCVAAKSSVRCGNLAVRRCNAGAQLARAAWAPPLDATHGRERPALLGGNSVRGTGRGDDAAARCGLV